MIIDAETVGSLSFIALAISFTVLIIFVSSGVFYIPNKV